MNSVPAPTAKAWGAIQAGNRVNLQKAAEIVIFDFRANALGRITLETPAQFSQWLLDGQAADAQRLLKKTKPSKNAKLQAPD